MYCKICNSATEIFATAKILHQYTICYYQCSHCGFVQTEEPYWLTEAYSSAIADADVGLVSRNLRLSLITKAIITLVINSDNQATFLDYGGGYGLLVRLMRDLGFDFRWYDKYCKNLFAQTFVMNGENYDIVTAFELFEHFVNPLNEINNIMKYSSSVLFSTETLPSNNPGPNEWWYYALDGGQHISFYTPKSLQIIADKYNKYYIGVGNIHLFSDQKIPYYRLYICVKFADLINKIIKRESLVDHDYKMLTE